MTITDGLMRKVDVLMKDNECLFKPDVKPGISLEFMGHVIDALYGFCKMNSMHTIQTWHMTLEELKDYLCGCLSDSNEEMVRMVKICFKKSSVKSIFVFYVFIDGRSV